MPEVADKVDWLGIYAATWYWVKAKKFKEKNGWNGWNAYSNKLIKELMDVGIDRVRWNGPCIRYDDEHPVVLRLIMNEAKNRLSDEDKERVERLS